MNRTALIILCAAASGCASTEALRVENAQLRHALDAAKALVQGSPASAARDDNPITSYAPMPYVAFVEFQPGFCKRGMCLAIRNGRDFPVSKLWIDGQRVIIRMQNGLIWPGQTAYIRLSKAGRHAVAAHLVDAVTASTGFALPTTEVVEHCAFNERFPGPSTVREATRVSFDVMKCWPAQ